MAFNITNWLSLRTNWFPSRYAEVASSSDELLTSTAEESASTTEEPALKTEESDKSYFSCESSQEEVHSFEDEEPEVITENANDVPITTNTKRVRILVAEDSPVPLRMIQAIKKSHKSFCQIKIVKRGDEALTAVSKAKKRKRDYDAIFLDNQMPGMTGAEAFKKIREDNPHVPVFVQSDDKRSSLEVQFKLAEHSTGSSAQILDGKLNLKNFKDALERKGLLPKQ